MTTMVPDKTGFHNRKSVDVGKVPEGVVGPSLALYLLGCLETSHGYGNGVSLDEAEETLRYTRGVLVSRTPYWCMIKDLEEIGAISIRDGRIYNNPDF